MQIQIFDVDSGQWRTAMIASRVRIHCRSEVTIHASDRPGWDLDLTATNGQLAIFPQYANVIGIRVDDFEDADR